MKQLEQTSRSRTIASLASLALPLPFNGRRAASLRIATFAFSFAQIACLAFMANPGTASAAECPNEAIRLEQNSTYLPDCRAYEQVSPVDKSGYPVFFQDGPVLGLTRSSLDGDSVLFSSWGSFGDSPSGMPANYLARRSATGWTTRLASPPPATLTPNPYYETTWRTSTPDLTIGVLGTPDAFDPTDTNTAPDVYTQTPGGAPVLASRGNGTERVQAGRGATQAGISPDGSTVAFETASHLVPADAARVAGQDLYIRANNRTEMVNLNDEGGLLNTCGSILGSGPEGAKSHAISLDGSHIVFQTGTKTGVPVEERFDVPDCLAPSQVYVRVNGAETLHASASQRTDCADHTPCSGALEPDPIGPRPATFTGASADGGSVFFYSSEMLVDSAPAGGGLYEFHPADSSLQFVVGTGDSGEADGGVMRISDDGSHIFFVSKRDVTGDGTDGVENIYVNHNGEVEWLASVRAGDLTGTAGPAEASREVYATPTGSSLVFAARAQLTDYDNSGCVQSLGLCSQIYLYSEGTPGITCISCDPAGQRPIDSPIVSDARLSDVLISAQGLEPERVMSANGNEVFFTSADQLVPGDTNRERLNSAGQQVGGRDVYEYRDGRLSLITTGGSANDTYLVGTSEDGSSVFFATFDPLVAADRDGNNEDIYAARVNGGFPEGGAGAEASCVGESCQPTVIAPPPNAAGSEGYTTTGSNRGKEHRPGRAKRRAKRHKHRTHRHKQRTHRHKHKAHRSKQRSKRSHGPRVHRSGRGGGK